VRSALRASGASTVLIPSSAVAAVAAAAAVALAVAVESDDDVDVDDDGSARANKDGRNGSSVLLLGLAAGAPAARPQRRIMARDRKSMA
jgi:hypothetical protein